MKLQVFFVLQWFLFPHADMPQLKSMHGQCYFCISHLPVWKLGTAEVTDSCSSKCLLTQFGQQISLGLIFKQASFADWDTQMGFSSLLRAGVIITFYMGKKC